MTAWIIRQAQEPSEENTELLLPFDSLPDLSSVRSEGDMRTLLQMLAPDSPPETIARQAEIHWRNVSELAAQDLVLVPRASGSYALGEIISPYHYRVDDGRDVHYACVRWLKQHIPKRSLSRMSDDGFAMQRIDAPDARKQIFALTPHPTNRFYKWRWLLVVMFVMQMMVMLLGMVEK